jgi:uncharacterized protein (UPF0264 family)
MTQLLVSVRSLEEAKLAASAGVDLVDLKEPRNGSLGRVELNVAGQVAGALAPRTPLSMALGELAEWAEYDWQLVRHSPPGILFAKVGLAHCANQPNWREAWSAAIRLLPQHCAAVAVIYADWRQAAAPHPASIVDEACRNGCRALLVDTFHKNAGHVFAHCSVEELSDAFDRAQKAGLITVLAGSLQLVHFETLTKLSPDYIGVRGAVCEDRREGHLCPSKLNLWINRLAS